LQTGHFNKLDMLVQMGWRCSTSGRKEFLWGSYKGVDVWAYVYTRDEWAGFPASVPTPTTGGFPNPNWNWATSSLGRFLNFGNGDEAATIMGKLDLIQGGLIVALEVATSLIDLESPEALAGAA
jgi:hypothetical protein